MYIYIFEDGSVKKSSTYSDEDAVSVGDGILDVIDISNPDNPIAADGEGGWLELVSAD